MIVSRCVSTEVLLNELYAKNYECDVGCNVSHCDGNVASKLAQRRDSRQVWSSWPYGHLPSAELLVGIALDCEITNNFFSFRFPFSF